MKKFNVHIVYSTQREIFDNTYTVTECEDKEDALARVMRYIWVEEYKGKNRYLKLESYSAEEVL